MPYFAESLMNLASLEVSMRTFYQEGSFFPSMLFSHAPIDPATMEQAAALAALLPPYFQSLTSTEFELHTLEMHMSAFFQPEPQVEDSCLYPIVLSKCIQSAAHFTRRSGWDCYQLVYTFHGHGVLRCDHRTYRLAPGSFFLIDCRKQHYFYADDPIGWGYSMIHFDGLSMDYLFPQVTRHGHCFSGLADSRAYRRYLRLFALAKEMPEDFDLQFHCVLTELLAELSAMRPMDEPDNQPPWLTRVQAYLTQNYNQEIRLEELAKMSYLSTSRFSHRFKALMGVSPIDYQYRLRISRACELLKYSDHTIQQIATIVGFANENNFYTKFRAVTGQTPGHYRTENRP